MNNDLFEYLERSLGSRPNTGMMAIIELIQSDLKLLYITGINFYKTSYYKNYKRSESLVLYSPF